MESALFDRAVADTAAAGDGGAPEPRIHVAQIDVDSRAQRGLELREGRSQLVVAEQGARAHRAAGQLPAAGDLVGEPVQPVGGVGGELLQAGHGPDLGRDPDQVAAVEQEVLDRRQLGDARWQGDDLPPLFRAQLSQRTELFAPVSDSLIDQVQQVLPARS